LNAPWHALNAALAFVFDQMRERLKAFTITADRSCGDALRLMVERGHNVLPVIEAEGDEELAGMVSLPELLEHEIDHLANELDAVTNYFTADGAGGD
jgi:CBS domain-containing protein